MHDFGTEPLRVTVGDPELAHSGTWRFWTQQV